MSQGWWADHYPNPMGGRVAVLKPNPHQQPRRIEIMKNYTFYKCKSGHSRNHWWGVLSWPSCKKRKATRLQECNPPQSGLHAARSVLELLRLCWVGLPWARLQKNMGYSIGFCVCHGWWPCSHWPFRPIGRDQVNLEFPGDLFSTSCRGWKRCCTMRVLWYLPLHSAAAFKYSRAMA